MTALADSVWILLAVTGAVLWVGSRAAPDRVARPGAVVAAVLANRVGRALMLSAWMFAGWHFFAR